MSDRVLEVDVDVVDIAACRGAGRVGEGVVRRQVWMTGSECQNSTLKSPCAPIEVVELAVGGHDRRLAGCGEAFARSSGFDDGGREGVVAAGLEGQRIRGDEGERRGLREGGQQRWGRRP